MSYVLMLAFVAAFAPYFAHAIIPPDLIVTVGTNLLQILGIVVLAVMSAYSAITVFTLRGFAFAKQYGLILMVLVNVLGGGFLYYYIQNYNQILEGALTQVDSLTVKNAQLDRENALLRLASSSDTALSPCADDNTSTNCLWGREFYSESYTVVGDGIVLELDTNRIELVAGSGVFNHYTYLNGTIDGTPVSLYASTVASSSAPVPHDFVKRHFISTAADLSTRASFEVSLDIDGLPVTLVMTGSEGDFVTRDSIIYTRTHSVAQAVVTVNGQARTASAFVERTHSSDADAGVFFPGFESVEATTAQFLLWDSVGNFYLFDTTDVKNPVPQYRSHTWLLRKFPDGRLEKSFSGSYETLAYSSRLAWEVRMPEFDEAVFTLSAPELFKSQDGRIRVEISGTVRDLGGERSVRGVGHLIH